MHWYLTAPVSLGDPSTLLILRGFSIFLRLTLFFLAKLTSMQLISAPQSIKILV